MIESLVGKDFGRLKVIRRLKRKSGVENYLCICSCGNKHEVLRNNLLSGNVQSCGCLKHDTKPNLSHGMKGTRIYRIWSGIKTRCLNENDKAYQNYGGRGIKLYKDWEEFEKFWEWAQKTGYNDNLTIERMNVNGNYEPNNCTWITLSEQANNRTNTVSITLNGITKTAKEWSKITKIEYPTIMARLKRGWSEEKTLTTKSLINRKEEHKNDK